MKFICSIAWFYAVLFGFLQICFALQEIDRVELVVKEQAHCAAAGLAFNDGFCRMNAKAEGNLDRSWTFTALEGNRVSFSSSEPLMMTYDATDWSFKGGKASAVGLSILALLLGGAIPLYGLMKKRSA